MVTPFPYKSSLQSFFTIEQFPQFLYSSRTISHGMKIFTHYMRFFKKIKFCNFFHCFNGSIHCRVNIRTFRVSLRKSSICFKNFPCFPFIVYKSAVITFFHIVSHGGMIFSITGFISERPHNNRRMIFIPFHHSFSPV